MPKILITSEEWLYSLMTLREREDFYRALEEAYAPLFVDLFSDLTFKEVEPEWSTVKSRQHGFDLEVEAHFSVEEEKEHIVTQAWVNVLQAAMQKFLLETDTLPSGISFSAWPRPSFRASWNFGQRPKKDDKFAYRQSFGRDVELL